MQYTQSITRNQEAERAHASEELRFLHVSYLSHTLSETRTSAFRPSEESAPLLRLRGKKKDAHLHPPVSVVTELDDDVYATRVRS